MGKRILVQHRGRGGAQYRSPQKGKIAPARYPDISEKTTKCEVVDILHERGRDAPLTKLRISQDNFSFIPAITGTIVGSIVEIGDNASFKEGNILRLKDIPEGSTICNIEMNQGDGGKLVKSAGGSALLFSHTTKGALIKLPSGKNITINNNCRASIGRIAGWGRSEKPFLKAGNRYYLMKSKNKLYPRVRGVAMAAVHHPFGGGRHQHSLKPTTTNRNAPPGRKVGLIAAKRTGLGGRRNAKAKIQVDR